MPSGRSNSETLKACYAKWHESKGGSLDDWMAILDDEIDFRSLAMGEPENIGFTAPCKCPKEVRGYLEGLVNEWDMVHYTVDEMVEQGDTICVIGSTAWTNKATGKTMETPKVDVWRFRDGRACGFFEYYDTAKLIEGATP